jgi:predicted metal-binding protein
MTSTSVVIDGRLNVDTNCTELLGGNTTSIIKDSISSTVEPTLGDNRILQGVEVTSICKNNIFGRKLQEYSTITYTLQVAEVCGNDCDTNPVLGQTLANAVQSKLIESINDGSFEVTLHQKCMMYDNKVLSNASVGPATSDDFVYVLVTKNPTPAPSVSHLLLSVLSRISIG